MSFEIWIFHNGQPDCDQLFVGGRMSYLGCSVRLYLQLYVGGRMSYLRSLCLFTYSGVQHILCCVFVLFSSSGVSRVSLNCQNPPV
jgi:hypothetical protein